MRGEVGRLTNLRAAEAAKAGNPGPGGVGRQARVREFNKRLYDFCIDLLGADGMIGYDYTFRRPTDLDATVPTRVSSTPSSECAPTRSRVGTSEILRNILGEQVLGLPGEPRVDKDVCRGQRCARN